jgi:hypothetical protein
MRGRRKLDNITLKGMDEHSNSMNESNIRNYLAENLQLLQPDLKLIKKEYPLENPYGAKGFVDIVAKDQFGVIVVIEIKRSNKSSREALHELYKYSSLLIQELNLDVHKFRCILVSTSWHELLLPFSEFCQTVEYHVDGYKLSIEENMQMLATKVDLLPKSVSQDICQNHIFYLFEDRTSRNINLQKIINIVSFFGLKNFVLLEMEYDMKFGPHKDQILFPFAYYFAFSSLNDVEKIEIDVKQDIFSKINYYGLSHKKWGFEEIVLMLINQKLSKYVDDTEIGYPEKFASSLTAGWQSVQVLRYGLFRKHKLVISDDDVVSLIKGVDGVNNHIFSVFMTPKHEQNWKYYLEKLFRFLEPNQVWITNIMKFLSDLPQNSSVSIYIYDPRDIILSLSALGSISSFSYMPEFEICVDNYVNNTVSVLKGIVAWDGGTLPTDPKAIFENIIGGGAWEYGMLVLSGKAQLYQAEIMKRHGLQYLVYEMRIESDEEPKIVYLSQLGLRDMGQFLVKNTDYLKLLASFTYSIYLGAFEKSFENVED